MTSVPEYEMVEKYSVAETQSIYTVGKGYGSDDQRVMVPSVANVLGQIKLSEYAGKAYPNVENAKKFIDIFQVVLDNTIKDRNANNFNLPRLHLEIDGSGAFLFSWGDSKFRAFFSIEKKDEDSFYGVHQITDSFGSTSSRSSKMTEDDYYTVLNGLIPEIIALLQQGRVGYA